MPASMAGSKADTNKVAGRYELLEPLGKGGMGTVWRGRDEMLGRQVAIKEVRFPAGGSAEELSSQEERVMREARAAARLNHPGVVGVYDVIKDDGQAFIIMELVEAPTVADLVGERGPLEPSEAARITLGVLDALEHAHGHGIVHRDVKPANVMVPEQGAVKLSDFGIVSVEGDRRLTMSGMIIGSPSYMAPEQTKGGEIGPAVDVWGLGATLYFMLTGQPPFDRGGAIPTLTAVINEEPDLTSVSDELRPAIEAALAKDPEERASYEELRSLLRPVSAPAAVPARTAALRETGSQEAPRTAEEVVDEQPARDRSGWWVAALIGALLLGGLAFLMTDGPREQQRGEGSANRGRSDEGEANQGRNEDQGQNQGGGGGDNSDTGSGSIPDGWTTYTDPAGGYTIAHPEGWQVEDGQYETQKNITDPDTGAYMRVEWTDQPGDDVPGRLQEISDALAARVSDFNQISLEPVEYRDYDAALSEYTYSSGGATLHAYNLQFVTDGFGYALNFQSSESNWSDLQDEFEIFKESFQPRS